MPVTTAQAVFAAYMLLVLLVGIYAARFTEHTPTDFYVAGRTVGPVVLGMTLVATVLSAFTVFGIGATTTATGLGAFSFLGIAAVLYTLVFASVGVALLDVGRRSGVLTPAEYVRNRYRSPLLGVVYLAVTGVFMVAMVAGQLIGGGVALESLLDIPYLQAIGLMAAFMLVYMHIAGYRGVIWSDTMQAAVLFAVLGGVFAYVLLARDPSAIAADVVADSPAFFDLIGPIGEWTPLAIMTAALAFAAGVPGYPQSIQRYFSAMSGRTMQRAGFLFAIVAIPTYFFAAVIGAWSLGLIPTPENADYVIPLTIETLTNPAVFGLAMAGATAAIMSTADSVALTMSSMVSRDIYVALLAPEADERRQVRVTQAMLVTVVGLAVALAWVQPAGIFGLIEFAVVGFATTTAPVFLGVYWRRGTPLAGIASLVLGPGITILFFLEVIPPSYTFGMHYGFVGTVIAYVIFIGVSVVTDRPDPDTVAEYTRTLWQ